MTVVTPTGKKLPGPKLLTTLATPEASVKVGSVHVAAAALLPVAAVTVWEAGQFEVEGPVVSTAVEREDKKRNEKTFVQKFKTFTYSASLIQDDAIKCLT